MVKLCMSAKVLLFMKTPVPGKVKSRLAKDIGDEKAASLYSGILKHCISECVNSGFETLLYANEDPSNFLKEASLELNFKIQRGKSIGEKMSVAFEEESDGENAIILVGSDIPGINSRLLESAVEGLSTHDIVLGPAMDGGYYLIGMKKYYPEVFENIKWSSSSVLGSTIDRINNQGLTYILLEELRDIDTIEDLNYFPELKNII